MSTGYRVGASLGRGVARTWSLSGVGMLAGALTCARSDLQSRRRNGVGMQVQVLSVDAPGDRQLPRPTCPAVLNSGVGAC
jgi:hypothetical protein